MTGIYTERQHVWGEALPGQGKQRVCKACGCRESVAPTSCVGDTPVPEHRTVHEYDPHE